MIGLALTITTALPWLTSLLLTDIFAGLSVLSLFLLVVHGDEASTLERMPCSCSRRSPPRRTARRSPC